MKLSMTRYALDCASEPENDRVLVADIFGLRRVLVRS